MLRWLNYHHLLYFRVIATEGSIARASERLLIGQPALSSQLKQLEENLGQKLFERKNRRLVLTEAGKVALEYADEIFLKGEEFVQVFNEQSLSSKALYKIGVIDSVPKVLACQLTEDAQKFGDNCFISLTEGVPDELLKKLTTHEIDLMLTNTSAVGSIDGTYSKSLGKYQVGVYGAKKFKKLQKGFPQSLNGQSFILPTRHTRLRADIEHFFHENRIHYDLSAEVQDSGVKKLMAEHGKALVFLPDFAAKPLVKDGKLIKIGSAEELLEEYWLLCQKRTMKTPLTDKLMKIFLI